MFSIFCLLCYGCVSFGKKELLKLLIRQCGNEIVSTVLECKRGGLRNGEMISRRVLKCLRIHMP